MKVWSLAAVTLMLASTAHAGDITVTVQNVRSAKGEVMVAVCDKDNFLKENTPCKTGRAPAAVGAVEVSVTAVPPGNYAVQVYHDENGNNDLDRNFIGIPTEGTGFSRGAKASMGPPRFDDAVIPIGAAPVTVTVTLAY